MTIRTSETLAVEEVHTPHAVGEHELVDSACEPSAVLEVYFLHAFGEQELVDGTCGREGKKREYGKDKLRNEEACAAAMVAERGHKPIVHAYLLSSCSC